MNAEIKERVAAINSGIIPEGYKKTKVGIVPVEWDIKALGKISQFLDNQRKPVKENERSSGIYPYYGASGIIDYVDDYLFDGEYILLGEDGANIVMRSSPLAFKVKGKMWINNHAHVISPNDNCNIDFLVNILESLNYEKYNSGTAQPKLNREVCESITLPFPPLPEQQKIAEILSTQDKLIELQEKKIEQLKELKKAYLQKMFPQKGSKYPELRFKGFTEPWEQRKLGDIGETYTGLSGKNKEDFGHGNAKFVTYMNVFSNSIADSSMTESVEIDKKQNEVKYGDVFFTTSSETPDEVGMSSVWLENGENTYLNSFCFGYRPSVKINPYYMAYMLRSDNVRKNIVFLAQGISRYNISKNKMMEISVPLPALEEQQRIGEYFRNLDTLITLHQRKSEQEKQKKKALMQLLLTGIVRTK